MSLPNGAGGYQVGDGNVGEARLFVQNEPTVLQDASTTTPAQLANGLFLYDFAGEGYLTLPSVALLEADVSSAQKVNATFKFSIMNINGGGDVLILRTVNGWTIVGSDVVADETSAQFLARKTGVGTWVVYRIS